VRRRAGLGVALAILVVAGAPGRADALCRSRTVSQRSTQKGCNLADPTRECQSCGAPLYWPTRCVGMSIDTSSVRKLSGDLVQTKLREAFERWSNVDCSPYVGAGAPKGAPSIEARYLEPVTCRDGFDVGKPSSNALLFQDNAWPHAQRSSGGIDEDSDTLALTTLRFDTKTGEIFGGTLEMNTAQHDFEVSPGQGSKAFDLDRVLTHEVGHFLGLAHTDVADGVMYWAAKPGQASSELAEDDRRAICEAYPPGGTRTVAASVAKSGQIKARACEPTPAAGFATTCADDEGILGGCTVSPRSGLGTEALASVAGSLGLLAAALRRRGRHARAPSGVGERRQSPWRWISL
jgi:hypothetical protein